MSHAGSFRVATDLLGSVVAVQPIEFANMVGCCQPPLDQRFINFEVELQSVHGIPVAERLVQQVR